jgi:hypothetical protein
MVGVPPVIEVGESVIEVLAMEALQLVCRHQFNTLATIILKSGAL